MTHKPAPQPAREYVAMAAAIELPEGEGAPEWVHLLPAMHGAVQTYDGRGPYVVKDLAAIIAASFADTRGLPIDVNHATQLAAPKGLEAPAVGWIDLMQERADGLWGRPNWTEAGRKLVEGRAYRGLSPVFLHDATGTISRITTVSLVNKPNLRGLAALHMETSSMDMDSITAALGLDATATTAQIVSAIKALKAPDAAMQSAMTEIGAALGVEAAPAAILAAALAAKTSGPAVITALQAEVAVLTSSLNAVTAAQSQDRATSFVDGEIKRGRAGVKPLREHYIAMHMQDPARVEKELGALPVLNATGMGVAPPAPKDGTISLNAEQEQVAAALGMSNEAFADLMKKEKN